MENKLKKIETLIYVIIVILAIDTVALFASLRDTSTDASSKGNSETETETEYDVSMFKTINADEFIDAYNGSELQVVYFGRATCSFCVKFLPSLQQAQKEYGYKTLYVDITTVDSEAQQKLTSLNDYISENYGRTPMILLVKDGQIVASQMGYTEYSTFAKLLEDNGFTKKN